MILTSSGYGGDNKAPANSIPQEISSKKICELLTRTEVESVIGKPLQEGKTNPKLSFPGTYYCEWRAVGGVVPVFTLYYYTHRFSTLSPYAMYESTQPITGLSHKAIAVSVPSDHTIAQFISYTDKAVLSFVLFKGLPSKSPYYQKAVQLLDKISQKAP